MALAISKILFIIVIIAAVFTQFFLYRRKNQSGHSLFIINMLVGIVLSYLAFTALPANYTGQKVLAIAWGVIAVVAVVLKVTNEKFITLSKILLSIAIIGGVIQLLA